MAAHVRCMRFSITLPALGVTVLEERLPAHYSLLSADLCTQVPMPGNLPTVSNGLLQSLIIRCLAMLPPSNSHQCLFQHLALFSASPHELFLTPISHLHSFFVSLEQQIPPVYKDPLTAQPCKCGQASRYLSHGPDAASNKAAMPRASPFTVVKPGYGGSRTQTWDINMSLGLPLNQSHGYKLLDCAGHSRVLL